MGKTYNAIWFDTRTATESNAGVFASGADYSLVPPSQDDWVFYLYASGIIPSPSPTPSGPTPTPGANPISNLNPSTYVVVPHGLVSGSAVYIDRAFTYTTIPSFLINATYIQTANGDKAVIDPNFLSFTLTQNASVYIAHDIRITTKPSWLSSSFTKQPEQIITSDTTFDLYKKDYPAGSVTLGGNEGGGNSMYSVIVVPSQTTIGDLNADNTVNIQDIIILINEIFTPSGVVGADINTDNIVNLLDVIALINIIFS